VANAAEIADLITQGVRGPQGAEDVAIHTGVVKSWTPATNVVTINGVDIPNVKSLQSGIGVTYYAGDVVMIVRKQTQYFVLGRVSSPGAGIGSVVDQMDGNFVTTFGTGGAFGDHPTLGPTPQITVYTRLRTIVFFKCTAKVSTGSAAWSPGFTVNASAFAGISFAVSGATTIAPGTYAAQGASMEHWLSNPGSAALDVTNTLSGFLMVPTNYGQSTFTLKYQTGAGNQAVFSKPSIMVVPL
jgi:hypothetical protein